MEYGTLVAFSGTVQGGGMGRTEAQMNGFPETQTANAFRRLKNRFLVVATKLQTGFDEPLIHTMYVDKKLGGVNAVQTIARINRTHPERVETMVLDLANQADEIQEAFGPYCEETILSEGTDPNILYDRLDLLYGLPVLMGQDGDGFAEAYFVAQFLTFTDPDFEKLYHYGRLLRWHLPPPAIIEELNQ